MPKSKRSRTANGAFASSATVPAGIFKARCLELIDRVKETGVEYIITKHGKPHARLAPLEPTQADVSPIGWLAGTVLRYDDPTAPTGERWEAED